MVQLKRQSITGSVAVVDSKKISDRISTTVTGALEGSAPGVQVNNSYGEPGATPKIHIRGVGTLVKDLISLFISLMVLHLKVILPS